MPLQLFISVGVCCSIFLLLLGQQALAFTTYPSLLRHGKGPSYHRQNSIASTESGTEKQCLTYEILTKLKKEQERSGGAGSSIDVEGLKRLDAAWAAVRDMEEGGGPDLGPAPIFVEETDVPMRSLPQFDVVVAGGTLGIFMACALQLRGFRVCVVERGLVKGRTQEWNISRNELMEYVKLGVISEDELDEIIGISFNPIRVGFMGPKGPYELLTKDVLNLGVFPSVLIDKARARFEAAGGVIREKTVVDGVVVSPNGVLLRVPGEKDGGVAGRLLIDCMGNASPIIRQVRWGQRPDGVCLVVGTMATGYAPENNTMADLIYTNTPTLPKGEGRPGIQYFWEAFPASSGPDHRTTYLFHYMDPGPARLSLLECWEDYWKLLPDYQNIESIDQLTFQRAVCQFFPTYKDSPLPTRFDRICQIGDASGIQSPLSFGGFASLSRHLPRLCEAFTEALRSDCLCKEDLGLVNAYQPSLSTTWMFQRAMSVPMGTTVQPYFINRGLINTFSSMTELGDPVLKPFLQDVVQAVPLAKALWGVMLRDPFNTPFILLHVGPDAFFGWFYHYINLLLYTLGHNALKGTKDTPFLAFDAKLRFKWNRILELLEFGSGLDYKLD